MSNPTAKQNRVRNVRPPRNVSQTRASSLAWSGERAMIHERNERFGAAGTQEDHGHSLRRRWWALAVILSVALAGALLGQMSVVRGDAAHPTPPGPLDRLPF